MEAKTNQLSFLELKGDGAPGDNQEDVSVWSKEGFDLLEVAVANEAPPVSRNPGVEVEY